MKSKFFVFVVVLFACVSLVCGANVTYTSNDNGVFVDVYNCKDNVKGCSEITTKVHETKSIPYSYNYSPESSIPVWKNYYFYKEDKRLVPASFNDYGTGTYNQPLPIFTGYKTTDLDGEYKCKIVSVNNGGNNLNIVSNLKSLALSSGEQVPIPSDLVGYYYTKTQVKAELYKDGTLLETVYADNSQSNNNYQNFVLLKPGTNDFSFNLPDNRTIVTNYGAGSFIWKFSATPIDLKCDFDLNGVLDSNEFATGIINKYLYFDSADADNDGTYDVIDDCETLPGTESNGCTYDYVDVNHTEVNGDAIQEAGEESSNKVIIENERDAIFVNSTNGREVITLPEVVENIRVVDNGVEREEKINPQVVALKAHKVAHLKNKAEAELFVNDAVSLMEQFDITKEINYDASRDRSSVKVSLAGGEDIENLTLYQLIPKEAAESLDDISFVSDGGAERFYVDGDPIIGWRFDEGGGDIEYEVDGESEGGTIIITQEPILFNEGDLIVRYRERDCLSKEALLFELDDFEDSPVYSAGGGRKYKVCISHVSLDLKSAPVLYSNKIELFTFTDGGSVSFDGDLEESCELSVSGSSFYWDLKFGEDNPGGDYSCIGSVDGDLFFGDCGYTENRVWIHLGEDIVAPTTQFFSGGDSWVRTVFLSAQDNVGGSGVSEIKYCVCDGLGNCDPLNDDGVLYSGPFDVSCESYHCEKKVRFYSSDFMGNSESVQEEVLYILGEGRNCLNGCVGSLDMRLNPACNKIGGCKYLSYMGDEGEYVAVRCKGSLSDVYVNLNDTHEVLCPDGGTRRRLFTNETISVVSQVGRCSNIFKTPFNVIVEGEIVELGIYFCYE